MKFHRFKVLGLLLALCAVVFSASAAWADAYTGYRWQVNGQDMGSTPPSVTLKPGDSAEIKITLTGTKLAGCRAASFSFSPEPHDGLTCSIVKSDLEYHFLWTSDPSVTFRVTAPSDEGTRVFRCNFKLETWLEWLVKLLGGSVNFYTSFTVSVSDPSSHQQPSITDGPTSVRVKPGGTVKVSYKGDQYTRNWSYGGSTDGLTVERYPSASGQNCDFIITTSDATEDEAKWTANPLTIRAYNQAGDKSDSRALTLTADTTGAQPTIDDSSQNQIVYGVQGGVATATLTGRKIFHWDDDKDNRPLSITDVVMFYTDNPNRCDALVAIAEDAKPVDWNAISADVPQDYPKASFDEWVAKYANKITVNAYGQYGDKTSTELDVVVLEKHFFTPPEFTVCPETVTVGRTEHQGGALRFRVAANYAKSWRYTLSDEASWLLDAVTLDYSADDPTVCDVILRATDDWSLLADHGVLTITAYNTVGSSTAKDITVYVTATDFGDPEITVCPDTVEIVPGGTVQVDLEGNNLMFWEHGPLPDNNMLKGIDFKYESIEGANKVTAIFTAAEDVIVDERGTIKLSAYNGALIPIDREVTVKIVSASGGPVIEDAGNWMKHILLMSPGDTDQITLRAKDAAYWTYGTLPPWLKSFTLSEDVASDGTETCVVRATANQNVDEWLKYINTSSSSVQTQAIDERLASDDVTIYAMNQYGEMTSADVRVIVYVTDINTLLLSDDEKYVMDLVPGEKRTFVFAAETANAWNFTLMDDKADLAARGLTIDAVASETDTNGNSTYSVTVKADESAPNSTTDLSIIAYLRVIEDEIESVDGTTMEVKVASLSSGKGSGGCDAGLGGWAAAALAALFFLKGRRS